MKVSIIVLSWNGVDYLEDCLDAVLCQDYPDVEVIVVDNGSADGSADFVAAHYPDVRIIRNGRNLGFSAGNNVGLRTATGDALILLNQDTVVESGWLGALVEAVLDNPGTGIAGGKALYPDGTIQHAGGYVNERGWGSHYGYQCEDVGQFDQMRDVDYVTGAALVVTRRALGTIGGLDERFEPAYFEDLDWCYRARMAGFRVVYVPRAVLMHRETSMLADASHRARYLFHRNRVRFVLKHWSLQRLVDEFVQAERAWLESLIEGDEQVVAAMHHAYLYHLLHLADVVAGRKGLMGVPQNEADVLADVLLTLRVVVPLRPARLGVRQAAVPDQAATVHAVDQTASSEADVGERRSPSGTVSEGELVESRPEGAPSFSQDELLDMLDENWFIREHQLSSDALVFGPLVAAFRRTWNRVSTEQYVRPMIEQQSEFNANVVKLLSDLAGRTEASENLLDYYGGVLHGHVDRLHELEARLHELDDRLCEQQGDRQRLGEVLAEYIGENGREIAELAQEIRRLKDLMEISNE